MGYSFYSLFSYYLSSPFNFLILLFMQFLYVNEAVTLVVLLKIGLTGAFMAWYVLKKAGAGTDGSVPDVCTHFPTMCWDITAI